MSETPLSLYIDLEPGQIADIEVISRASLAFAAAIKEAAFMIDPSLEIQIGLVSGTEGSLNLNTFLKNLKDDKGEVLTLKAVAVVIALWFANHALDWTWDRVMDELMPSKEVAEGLNERQKEEFAKIVNDAINRKVAQPEVRRVYRELEHDPAVKGVGVSQVHNSKPAMIVPRGEFLERGGHIVQVQQTVNRRVRTENERVVLISPVLIEGTRRRWRFQTSVGEIGAAVLDQKFVDDLVTGRVVIPMTGGIELDVELETTEVFQNGVWEIVERNITHVGRQYPRPAQQGLPFAGEPGQSSQNDKKE